MKTFSFRYPQRKKSHGLKSGDRAGHPTSPLKEIKRPGNISLRANVVLCELWPRPFETTHVLYPHRSVWGAERSPAFQRTGRRSQLLLHHLPQKCTGRSHHSRHLHTKQLREESGVAVLGVHEGYVQPSSKILLVYGSTDMGVSLIATQENSCSGNLFKNFRTYGSAVGMISLT